MSQVTNKECLSLPPCAHTFTQPEVEVYLAHRKQACPHSITYLFTPLECAIKYVL